MSKHEGASQEERERLSRLLGVSEDELFGPGPAVTLSVNGFAGECEEADHAIFLKRLGKLLEAYGIETWPANS